MWIGDSALSVLEARPPRLRLRWSVARTPEKTAAAPPCWAAWRAAAFAAVAGILFARKPFALLAPQCWAEDLPVFFDQAWRLGWASVHEPYGGYLHLWPRLVALAGTLLDPAIIPLFYNATAWLTAAAVLSGFVSPRLGAPPWRACLVATVPVLLPHSGEVFCNLTNVQWFTGLWFAVVASRQAPATRASGALELGGLALAGLTGPFALMALPVFLWRVHRERTRWSAAMAGVTGVTAALQLACLLRHAGELGAALGGDAALGARVFAHRVVAQTLFAGAWTPDGATLALLTAGFGGLLVYAVLRARAAAGAMLLLISIGLPAMMLVRFGEILPGFVSHENGDRYFYFARVCSMWLLLVAAHRSADCRVRSCLLAAPVCAIVATVTVNFRAAAWDDLRWNDYGEFIRRGERVSVPTHPLPWRYEFPGRP